MKELIKKLNYFSLFRIVVGAAAVGYGIYSISVVFIVLGVFLMVMAVLNPSCCVGNKCIIKDSRKKAETDGSLTGKE